MNWNIKSNILVEIKYNQEVILFRNVKYNEAFNKLYTSGGQYPPFLVLKAKVNI